MVAAPAEHVRAWKPSLPGIAEVFHARFVAHHYPPHTHDAWTVIVVDQGAIRYDLDRHHHGSAPATVSVLPPSVVHDGRAATPAGFRKRVLYLEPDVVGADLIGAAVDRPTIDDPVLRAALVRLHHALQLGDERLAGEALLATATEHVRAHLARQAMAPWPFDRSLARRLRDHLDAHVFEPVTLADASAAVGASVTHLARSFRREFAVTPHTYVVGRRVEAARRLLLGGSPLANVATDVGFHDQAHFTRHFKRHVGVTPGAFVREARRQTRSLSNR